LFNDFKPISSDNCHIDSIGHILLALPLENLNECPRFL